MINQCCKSIVKAWLFDSIQLRPLVRVASADNTASPPPLLSRWEMSQTHLMGSPPPFLENTMSLWAPYIRCSVSSPISGVILC